MKNRNTPLAPDAQTKASSSTPKPDHFKVLHAFVALNGLSPKAKLVGIKLYLHESEEKGAFNAVPNLARDAGLGTTATREALRELTEAKVYRSEERPGTTTRYRSNPAALFTLVDAHAARADRGDADRRAPQRNPSGTPTEFVAPPQRNPLPKSSFQKSSQGPCEKTQSAASYFPDAARATGPGVGPGQRTKLESAFEGELEGDDGSDASGAAVSAAEAVAGTEAPLCAPAGPKTGDAPRGATQGAAEPKEPPTARPGARDEALGRPNAQALETNDRWPEATPAAAPKPPPLRPPLPPTTEPPHEADGLMAEVLARQAPAGPRPRARAVSTPPSERRKPTPASLQAFPGSDNLDSSEAVVYERLLAHTGVLDKVASPKFARHLAGLVGPGRPLADVLAGVDTGAAEVARRGGRALEPRARAKLVKDVAALTEGGCALLKALATHYPDDATTELADELDLARLAAEPPRSVAAAVAGVRDAAAKGKPAGVLKGFVRNAFEAKAAPAFKTADGEAVWAAYQEAVASAGRRLPMLWPEDVDGADSFGALVRGAALSAAATPRARRRTTSGTPDPNVPTWPPAIALRGPDEDESFGLTLSAWMADFAAGMGDEARKLRDALPPKEDWRERKWSPSESPFGVYGLGDDRLRDDLTPAERARLALENLWAIRTAARAVDALAWLLEGPMPVFAPRGEAEAECASAAEAAKLDPRTAWREPEVWTRRRDNARDKGAAIAWGSIELKHDSVSHKAAGEAPTLSDRERAVATAIGTALGTALDERIVRIWAEILGPDGSLEDAAVFSARRRALGGFSASPSVATYTGDAQAFFLGRRAKELGFKARAFDADLAAGPLPHDEADLDGAERAALATMRGADLWYATPARAARLARMMAGAPAHLLAWACRRARGDSDALDAELERLLDLHEEGVAFDAPESVEAETTGSVAPGAERPATPVRRFVRLAPAGGPIATAADVRARLATLPATTDGAADAPQGEPLAPEAASLPEADPGPAPAPLGSSEGERRAFNEALQRFPHLAEHADQGILNFAAGAGPARIARAVAQAGFDTGFGDSRGRIRSVLVRYLGEAEEEARKEAERGEWASRWFEAPAGTASDAIEDDGEADAPPERGTFDWTGGRLDPVDAAAA